MVAPREPSSCGRGVGVDRDEQVGARAAGDLVAVLERRGSGRPRGSSRRAPGPSGERVARVAAPWPSVTSFSLPTAERRGRAGIVAAMAGIEHDQRPRRIAGCRRSPAAARRRPAWPCRDRSSRRPRAPPPRAVAGGERGERRRSGSEAAQAMPYLASPPSPAASGISVLPAFAHRLPIERRGASIHDRRPLKV